MTLSCRIDHLVLACADLAQGAAFVRERLGVEVQPGGRHLLMGTHNALLKLGPRTYLELIANDPEGAAQRPRWFALDTPAVRERAAAAPFLLTWVARTDDIVRAVALAPAAGKVIALSRGPFNWRIAIPDDGSLCLDGVLPTLIQWHGDAHPAAALPDAGCELVRLGLSHPKAGELAAALGALGLGGPVQLGSGPVEISARIRTPQGPVDLR